MVDICFRREEEQEPWKIQWQHAPRLRVLDYSSQHVLLSYMGGIIKVRSGRGTDLFPVPVEASTSTSRENTGRGFKDAKDLASSSSSSSQDIVIEIESDGSYMARGHQRLTHSLTSDETEKEGDIKNQGEILISNSLKIYRSYVLTQIYDHMRRVFNGVFRHKGLSLEIGEMYVEDLKRSPMLLLHVMWRWGSGPGDQGSGSGSSRNSREMAKMVVALVKGGETLIRTSLSPRGPMQEIRKADYNQAVIEAILAMEDLWER